MKRKVMVPKPNEKLSNQEEVLENLKEIRNLLSGGGKDAAATDGTLAGRKTSGRTDTGTHHAERTDRYGSGKYQKEFDELVERHRQVKEKYEKQVLSSEQDVGRVAQIDYFISTLEKMEAPITEFDELLLVSMVYHVVVHSKEDIRVVYRDGIEK